MKRDIALLVAWSVMAMLPAYFLGFGGHDALIHGMWVKHFAVLLGDGIFYPRFADAMYQGRGNYVFFFYPPLTLYIGASFSLLAGSDANYYYTSLALSAHLAVIVGGLGFYWLARRNVGPAMLYMVMPYGLAYVFYIQAGMGMFWALAIFPYLMLAAGHVASGARGIGFYALTQGLLLLTNIPGAIIMSPLVGFYSLLFHRNLRALAHIALGALLGLALAAIYVLPMLALKQYVNVDIHWSERIGFDFRQNFVDGFDFSDEQHFLVFGIYVFYALWAVVLLAQYLRIERSRLNNILFVILFISLSLCLSISRPLWFVLPVLEVVQLPWRFMAICSLILPLLTVQLFSRDVLALLILPLLVFSYGLAYERAADPEGIEQRLIFNYQNGIDYYPAYIPAPKQVVDYFYNSPPESIKPAEANGSGNREITATLSGKKGEVVTINRFCIPFWEAGNMVSCNAETGLMQLTLDRDYAAEPVGIRLPLLRSEVVGMAVSALAFILVVLLVIRRSKGVPGRRFSTFGGI